MLSIIFPAYNEEDNLEALYNRLVSTVSHFSGQDFEFVFVDDGSTDRTPKVLAGLHRKDPRVKVIRFKRNRGSHLALAAGLAHCRGECAIVMAADLQDPPELIVQLIAKWRQGAKLVWAVRRGRLGERLTTRIFSRLYYGLMRILTSVKLPPMEGGDAFLADRALIDAFQHYPEKQSSLFMLMPWLDFPQAYVEYVKEARHKGRSKWTLRKKIKLITDSIIHFHRFQPRYSQANPRPGAKPSYEIEYILE